MGRLQHYQYYQPSWTEESSLVKARDMVLPRADAPTSRPFVAIGQRSTIRKSRYARDAIESVAIKQYIGQRIALRTLVIPGTKLVFIVLVGAGLSQSRGLKAVDQMGILYALTVLLYRLDSRLSFILALVELLEIPLLKTLHYDQYADTVSTLLFYTLATSVLMASIEYRKDSHSEKGTARLSDVTYRYR